jgi:hypothetical protein
VQQKLRPVARAVEENYGDRDSNARLHQFDIGKRLLLMTNQVLAPDDESLIVGGVADRDVLATEFKAAHRELLLR